MTEDDAQAGAETTSIDRALIIGVILMDAAAAATATLFAIIVNAIPDAALKALAFVALVLVGATLVNARLRNRLTGEEKGESGWYTAFVFGTQFFLALAWVALIVAIIIMVRMNLA